MSKKPGAVQPFVFGFHGCRRLDEAGFPLGLFPEAKLEIGSASLEPGDLLVLYSDGITEKGSHYGEEFGEQRLERVVSAHRGEALGQIQQRVFAALDGWNDKEPEDDMTLLLVRATAPTAGVR